jgi:hypothetical protein
MQNEEATEDIGCCGGQAERKGEEHSGSGSVGSGKKCEHVGYCSNLNKANPQPMDFRPYKA